MKTSEAETDIVSPCIKLCKLDKTGELCTGCYRLRSEIAVWSKADAKTKAAIIALAGERARAAE